MRELLGCLDQATGWCGVFWQRDPDGMRACLDGVEVPPWDVVQALLHDLAADRGIPEAERETRRARTLHRASLTAYDARPGARELLGERLDMMLTERRIALDRQADLSRRLSEAATPVEADRINLDLAWVRDDHERATARCAELQERLARLSHAFGLPPAEDTSLPARVPEQPRRPRGARYAGLSNTDANTNAPQTQADTQAHTHTHTHAPTPTPATPRGARYAPAPPEPPAPAAPAPDHTPTHTRTTDHTPTPDPDPTPDPTTQTVQALLHLRREGRTGEAHAVLVEAAAWPAPHLPPLAAELHRAGLAADWSTLLWEAASLPPTAWSPSRTRSRAPAAPTTAGSCCGRASRARRRRSPRRSSR
ncbi:hypothetical protein ACOBQB_05460 [Streptomyces sp. G5(2025)]|uniref:hypothetical protein n=1 Tax=Streptomyces sp. G5(2025) TaxID=3406628 RepID=UPI003C1E808A